MILWFQLHEDYFNLLMMTLLDVKFGEIISLVSPRRDYLINLNNSAKTYVSYYSENSDFSTGMAVSGLETSLHEVKNTLCAPELSGCRSLSIQVFLIQLHRLMVF